jgi:type IV pilus assembly protein PilB
MSVEAATVAVNEVHDGLDLAPGLIAPTRRGRSEKLIGQVIVELGFATREAVDAAIAMSKEQGRTTGQLLVEAGELRPDQLARALAERLGVDYVDLSEFTVDPAALALIDGDVAKRHRAIPVGFLADGSVVLAMADPTNVMTLDEMSLITGRKLRRAAAAWEDLAALIGRYNGLEEATAEVDDLEPDHLDVKLEDPGGGDAPVIKLVHQIIAHAVEQGASDVHLDPEPGDMQVLLRIDGVLRPVTQVPKSAAPGVVARIKVMSGINIAERRVPQDGRMRVTLDGHGIDIRVATLPLVGGEGAVLRILDTGAVVRDLESLGMQSDARERFLAALRKPYGAVLVTGPTGSGKSTTLYGALAAINRGDRSILTIEDPVESPVPGIKQMQVAIKAGLTFAAGLRSILRADPDVIMVGEIRDRETAEIAIQSALTGHLMLSTLHTRHAASAVSRLIDMGIEPFMVSAAIDCVVAQRLARTLCDQCKQPASLPDAVREANGLVGAEVFEPVGCIRCGQTGYTGRTGLYEVLSMSEELRAMVLERRSVDELTRAAMKGGMRTMRQDGLEKVRQGITSLVEVHRVTTTL